MLDEDVYNKLKMASLATRKPMTKIIEKLVRDHLDTLSHDYLIQQISKIPPEERLGLIHRANEEERQMEQDELNLKRQA